MKTDKPNSTQLLKEVATSYEKETFKNGKNENEILRRLKIQNKKLLQEVVNLKNQLKQTRSENRQMKRDLDDWVKLKKLILQSAWKY